jgi:hypothetical protein
MYLAAVCLLLSAPFQSTDTVVVRANNPPEWGEGARLVEEIRIGSVDGSEEYTFGRITGVAIGPEGSVYVGDDQIPVIRQFRSDGTWFRNIGRKGQGPGEYSSIDGMRSLDGRTLSILDQRNGRVTTYLDAEYHSSFPSRSGLFSADVFAVDTAGVSYVRTVLRDPGPGQLPTSRSDSDYGWVRMTTDGEVLDTLLSPPEESVGGGFVLAGKGGYYRPFTVMTLSTVSSHGYLLTARNDEYAVHRPLPDGRILRIGRDAERVAVKPAEKAQWEAWADRFRQNGGAVGGLNSKIGSIPGTKPYIRHLMADDDGRVWVATYAEAIFKPYSEAERARHGDRPGMEWNQPLVWEVFEPRGQFLGRLTLPDKTSLLAARGTTVWGSQAGAYGEEYLVRFRIRPSHE